MTHIASYTTRIVLCIASHTTHISFMYDTRIASCTTRIASCTTRIASCTMHYALPNILAQKLLCTANILLREQHVLLHVWRVLLRVRYMHILLTSAYDSVFREYTYISLLTKTHEVGEKEKLIWVARKSRPWNCCPRRETPSAACLMCGISNGNGLNYRSLQDHLTSYKLRIVDIYRMMLLQIREWGVRLCAWEWDDNISRYNVRLCLVVGDVSKVKALQCTVRCSKLMAIA